MVSKLGKTALVLIVVLTLGCTTWAQASEAASVSGSVAQKKSKTLKITIKGKIGPILSGSDPLGLDGEKGSVEVVASESLSPTSQSGSSVTYTLPAGAISVKGGKEKFKTDSPSTMTIDLTDSADILTLIAAGPEGLTVTSTTYLAAGSWTTGVLAHPETFTPSPQELTSAASAGGPGCQIEYVIEGITTVLGFSGTASNKDPVDPVLPAPDVSRYHLDQ
jgi:hypothetical protein